MSKRSLKGGGKGKRVSPAEDNCLLDVQPSCSESSQVNEAMFRNKFEQTDSDNEVPGKVKRILMKNFMNHSTMDIVLNPNVNFIVEHDGNGRSAIVTALTIGLGGKAITTSGDSSLREFIKDGADAADIEITVNNNGPFAQKPQEYGMEITISTMISSATGNASYKLKNGYGEIKDIEKEELEKIIQRFKIQIDNPVCILNQDTAEKLLNSRDPEELFGLFLKATSTVALAEACDYVLVRLNSEITRIIPQMKDLEFTANEVRQWELKQKLLLSVEEFKQRKSSLQNELHWAVREKSNEYKELLASKTTEYDQLQEKLKELASEQETLKSKCEEPTNIVTGFKRKRRAIVMQKEKLHSELECSEFEKEIHEKKYHDQCNCVHQLQKNLKLMDEGVKKAFNETMPPAICTERSRDEIKKEINDLTTYIEKKEERDMIEEVISIMKKNLELLELIVKLRFDHYTFELRLVTAAVQHEFQLLLDKHDLKGNVIIDIKKRTLQLAAPLSSTDGHTDGEISYLAVILIISLWNRVKSPIYVLNEVDACMHEEYRKEMMDLLVAHAEEAKNHQYIFLMQEDTSNVSPE